MRLINADRLLSDRMKSTYYHLPNGDTAIPIIDIEHAPTVDAVEVVRCKDCKYYVYGEDEEQYYCRQTGIGREEDFYCSYGERRTYEETIHQYHERHKEVLKEMSMPVGRNVMDALRERRTDETD